jgi:F-type H+-transporting ATPase subunit gamma
MFCTIGSKALGFFKRFGGKVEAQVTQLGDKPHIEDLIGTVKVMLNAFENGEIDADLHRLQRVRQHHDAAADDPAAGAVAGRWTTRASRDRSGTTSTSPTPPVLDNLLPRYIESLVYQAVVENGACEQAARWSR